MVSKKEGYNQAMKEVKEKINKRAKFHTEQMERWRNLKDKENAEFHAMLGSYLCEFAKEFEPKEGKE